MSRWVSSRNAAIADGENCRLCALCELDFQSGVVRLSDALVEVPWLGNTYMGLGSFGQISIIEENVDGIPRALQAKLFGPEEQLVKARTEVFQGRLATFWLALFNDSSGQLEDTPEILWRGRMDKIDFHLDGNESSLTLFCEFRLRREPAISRYTTEDQKLRAPTDKFFNFIPFIQGAKGKWGVTPISYARTPGGSHVGVPRNQR